MTGRRGDSVGFVRMIQISSGGAFSCGEYAASNALIAREIYFGEHKPNVNPEVTVGPGTG